jgi:hypothetical protein
VLKLLSDESTEFRGNSVLALLRRLVLVSEVRGISPEGSSNDAGGGILLAPCTADREAAAGKAAVTPCPALHFTWRNDLEGVQRLGIPALESVLLSPPFYARPHLGKMHSGSSQAGVVADAPGLAASAFRAAYDGAGASGAAVGRLGIWRKEIESYYGISDATSDAAAVAGYMDEPFDKQRAYFSAFTNDYIAQLWPEEERHRLLMTRTSPEPPAAARLENEPDHQSSIDDEDLGDDEL